MVDVINIQRVRIIRILSMLFVYVTKDMLILVIAAMLDVKVNLTMGKIEIYNIFTISDSCRVNNGGCGTYATCSHCLKSGRIICKCKTGYTNVGTENQFNCEGLFRLMLFSMMTSIGVQIVAK